jgi:gamma-glutamylcyclotransferase (GGCT)/AIG2-like uncharacterized protein YtfP
MKARTARLFVYGTLMPGQGRWGTLRAHALSHEPATAKGYLWDTGAGYPAARFDEAGHEIPGVLVTIEWDALTDLLTVLDRIEGEGSLFRRVEVVTSDGPAIAYEWMGSTEALSPLLDGWPASMVRRRERRHSG